MMDVEEMAGLLAKQDYEVRPSAIWMSWLGWLLLRWEEGDAPCELWAPVGPGFSCQ
jgi:hypothetical protein